MTGAPPAESQDRRWPHVREPLADRRANRSIVHGVELSDNYAWLRADNWREVLRDPTSLPDEIRGQLDRENAYAAAHLDPLADLTAALKAEMRGRIKEDDATVPLADGPWLYGRRYRDGGQHPLIIRQTADAAGDTVLIDGDAEAASHAFFSIGDAAHSPDHTLMAWSADVQGSEFYTIRVRACVDGIDTDRVENSDGSIVWMNDGSGFYYVEFDDNHRSCRVRRHLLGRPEDDLVFSELDPAWFVGIDRTVSGAFAVIALTDHAASECHLLDLDDPAAQPVCVEPRSLDHRYSVVHRGDELFIRTNADGAEDFKIVRAPVSSPVRANWVDVVAHRRGRIIVAMSAFPDDLVRLEREEGLPRIVIRSLGDATERVIGFEEEAYGLSLDERLEFPSSSLRFTYASMTTPRETWDYDLATGARRLLKRQAIPSGHDPSAYVTRRLFASAPDGERVPVTVLHRAGLALDGTAPLLLYGYGAYGHALPASFTANALSLVDRGFVYALAHIRGGTDKGWHWYQDGKLARKQNTFTDFLAVARTLVADGFTAEGRIVAQGGSAGGLLMGAVMNMAPELFAGVIAAVPFVDVLATILDGDLPLTPPEWLEWGNPITDVAAFETIRAYSPYDNIRATSYPPLLALAGLTDPRVTYWEPAKWVAKLRATMTGGGPIVLKTNMGAGHGGASGRLDRLAEIAEQYAFALRCVEPLIPR